MTLLQKVAFELFEFIVLSSLSRYLKHLGISQYKIDSGRVVPHNVVILIDPVDLSQGLSCMCSECMEELLLPDPSGMILHTERIE